MYLGVADDLLFARLDATKSFMELGTGSPSILLYTGTAPATKGAAVTTQVLLSTLAMPRPIGVISTATLTLSTPIEGLVLVGGTIGWARVLNGNGQFAFDCDVTLTGGGGVLTAASLLLYAGGTAKLISGVFA